VTRHRGGSFESRSPQAYPLQQGYAAQGKTSNWHGLGVPLERRSRPPAAPAQRSDRHNQGVPHGSGSQQGGRPVAVSTQRGQTIIEPENRNRANCHQPLPHSRTPASIKIGAQREQVLHQKLDRAGLAWSHRRQHEDHADSRMARPDPSPRFAQMEPS